MTTDSFGPYDFTLTKAEFVAYAQAVGRRQLRELDAKSWRLATFAALAVVAVLGGLAVSGVSDRSTLAAGALASGGAILIGRLMMRRQIARAQAIAIDDLAREGEAFAKPVRLSLDASGLSLEMGGARDARPFAELREVGRVAGLLVFWSGPNDGVALPDRALTQPGEADALLAFARSRITT